MILSSKEIVYRNNSKTTKMKETSLIEKLKNQSGKHSYKENKTNSISMI